ncbi:alpha/beta hydrolase [Bacillus sp. EB106-08-02-XG196]|jgi:predicted alpha/beta superfamily hydrolase|uniref:alpha/beta hydrolase n=1 Tax=Bacillus sp. EB106-08-02-XG196 TaxID=2737049 RepID=UPI0015C4B4E0|nr:alpha/beta hydrolase-fold protein [Bacillus sp. EB106-08-02-XG196]NWQ43184.1 alpha/beta hydrolase [Bacillus sp. EB106-08-02-XG196]
MVEKFHVYMSSFNQERMIRVYLPLSYHESNKRYPVLYMHDGQNVFEDEEAIKGVSLSLKDYLDKNRVELIVVAIDLNPEGEERINEYCPWVNGAIAEKIIGHPSSSGGKGEQYLDFIVNELKPLIDDKYRTLKEHTSMAGFSLGGLISTYAACTYPHIFKRIAAISPGYYRNQEELEVFVRNSDLSAVERFYMDFGTHEVSDDKELNIQLTEMIQSIYEILNSRIEDTRYQTIKDGEHNYTSFKKRFPEVLSYLFSDR